MKESREKFIRRGGRYLAYLLCAALVFPYLLCKVGFIFARRRLQRGSTVIR